MNTTLPRLLCTLALPCLSLAADPVLAQTAGRLNQIRSEMNSGRWEGVSIVRLAPKADVPASAASTAAGPGEWGTPALGAAKAASGAVASTAKSATASPAARDPAGSHSLSSRKRLEDPDLGIPLPTSIGASGAAGRSSKTP